MIEITGLSSVLETLAKLTDQETLDDVARESAESYRDDMLSYINAGKSFETRTGRLKASIEADALGNSAAHVGAGAEYNGVLVSVLRKQDFEIANKTGQPYYAPYVEFGTYKSAPYPFFFADIEAREANIMNIAIGVLESVMQQ